MPIHYGRDRYGPYVQWGGHGHKYRYIAGNYTSENNAYKKAALQGRAAYAHGYQGQAHK